METTEEIKNLYLEYATQNIEMPKEYYKISHTTELLKEELQKVSNEEVIQKLEKIYEGYKQLASIDCEQCFVYGYSLGTRLTAESFINKKWECYY